MKYALIIMDGAADEPLAELEGKTVLEEANIPNTDWISVHGRQGMVRTVPQGFSPGSDVATMSVLGYDPCVYHTGRAPLEFAAKDIPMRPNDWIFRCNLVTVADGLMLDYSAGHIDSVQGAKLIGDLNEQLGSEKITFYPGVGYRHLMVYRGDAFEGEIIPPHDIMDQPIAKHLPRGRGAKELCKLMEKAAEILAGHEVNKVRCDLGENQATNIWFWGQGKRPKMESFRHRFGIYGCMISAVDLLRGMAKLVGLKVIDVEGATGFIDTNYAGKGEAAIKALDQRDIVFVHVEAPDEAGHGAQIEAKIESIEQIDCHIVGPLLKWLQGHGDDWRIMVLPDHPTPISTRMHSSEAVPFAMAGDGIIGSWQQPYSEANGRNSGFRIDKGHELMEYFLKVNVRAFATK